MKDFDERFHKGFALVSFAVNRHILDHMRRASALLDLDFTGVYIFGVLAHLNSIELLNPGADPNEILDPDGLPIRNLTPVRLAALSEITRIPKETVRRRLEKLRQDGRVERTADGLWQFRVNGINADLVDFTKDSVRNLLRTADEVDSLIRRAT